MTNSFIYINSHTHNTPVHGIQQCTPLDSIPNHYFSIGIHPLCFQNTAKQWTLLQDITKNPFCLAIGECGLDKRSETNIDEQIIYFEYQITLAKAIEKPIIIHCVKAYDLLIPIIKKNHLQQTFIIHGFNQNIQIGKELLSMDCYFSLGKALLFENSNAQKLLALLPLELLLLETDDETNIPIEDLYEKTAKLLNLPLETITTQIQNNFKTLFHVEF